MIPEFTSAVSIAEIVWFLGIILFAAIIFLGKDKGRGPMINVGAVMLIISYSGLLAESMLSFDEIAILQWGVRVGITLILFDLARRTEVRNPKDSILRIKALLHKLRGKK